MRNNYRAFLDTCAPSTEVRSTIISTDDGYALWINGGLWDVYETRQKAERALAEMKGNDQ